MLSVTSYAIGSAPGLEVEVHELGATVRRVVATAPGGSRRNVVLAWPDGDHPGEGYLGVVAGRVANRIAGARFSLDGQVHHLAGNDRGQTLHGGPEGFDTRRWTLVDHGPDHVELELVSPDGDQGFPGELTVRARYAVAGDVLTIAFTATTAAPTVVNLAHHGYWNLAGTGDALDHVITVPAEHYVPIDDVSIPLGYFAEVAGSPLDLRAGVRVRDLVRAEHPQVSVVRGLDHDYVVPGAGLRECARLEAGGLRLLMESDQPGVQVYTGQALPAPFPPYAGVALEPQHHPDSANRPEWPSIVLRPGETYRSTTRVTIGRVSEQSLD